MIFKRAQIIFSAFAMALAVAICLNQIDTGQLLFLLTKTEWKYILCAFILTQCTLCLSTIRFGLLKQKMGATDSWKATHRTNLYSLLYSQIMLPLLTQIAGRIGHGSRSALKIYAPITVIEKILSLIVIIAVASLPTSYFLNLNIFFDEFSYAFLWLITVISISIIASIFLVLNPKERTKLYSLLASLKLIGIPSLLGVTLALQGCILLSLYFLSLSFVDNIDHLKLLAALSLVILASSVPISFSGWGIREVTSGAAFTLIGLPFEAGVLSGLAYGLVYLFSLMIGLLSVRKIPEYYSIKPTGQMSIDAESALKFACFFTLILMVFQIRIPLNTSLVNVNMADLLALLIGIHIIVSAYLGRQLTAIWSSKAMWLGLLFFITMIFFSWTIGYIKFQSNEWATINRLLGLVIIFLYLFSGATIRLYLPLQWIRVCIFASIYALILSFPFTLISWSILPDILLPFFNLSQQITGFLGDRNSLAFFSSMLLVLLFFVINEDIGGIGQKPLPYYLMGTVLALLIIASSRSGWGGAVVVFCACCLVFDRSKLKSIITAVIISSCVLSLLLLFAEFQQNTKTAVFERTVTQVLSVTDLRWRLYEEALDLFKTDVLFGAGLGAAIETTGYVVHNLPLWILSEAGIIGIFLVAPLLYAVVTQTFKKPFTANNRALLLFCLIVGGFGLVQDIAYQRALWLTLGFLMANPFQKQTSH